ncbi:MAG: HD-GYP domain-containing protein [Nitrospirae bacterium]|nr:HD-GYP domain-containing protein [Nitrospirota bacterium]
MIDIFKARTEDTAPASLKEMPPVQLRVGMYVILNCSWFKHPFPLKSFRLTSQGQIKTILGLGLKTVTVDMGKSDGAAFRAVTERTPAEAQPQSHAAVVEADTPPEPCIGKPPVEEAGWPDATPSPDPPPPLSIQQYGTILQKTKQTFKQELQDSSRMMKQLCSGSEEGFKTANQMVNKLNDLVKNQYNTSAIISMLNVEDLTETSALHALNVCALSMMVAKQFELSAAQIKVEGMGGLFHDVAEDQIPANILKTQGRLNSAQQRQYEEHPKLGAQIASNIPGFPDEALQIIREHHERLDGSGYPFGLKGERISLLSQIVMVVDEYDTLINPREPSHALSPSEALSELYVKRRGPISDDAIVALVQTLSVYPPGSIVELSDGSVGLVMSTNFRNRMRPMVLLYDPSVSQETPRIVNLMDDPSLAIDQLIPKHDIRPEVADYLSLKRWIGYFIHASMEAAKEQEASLSPAA